MTQNSIPGPPLGVCVLPEVRANGARTVSYPHYLFEILDHAGLCYAAIPVETLPSALPGLGLLVTIGDMEFPGALAGQLEHWLASGGRWLAVGGVCGLAELFGVALEAPAFGSFGGGCGTLGEGYLSPQSDHRILAHLSMPLHFFNGVPVRATTGSVLASVLDAHQRGTDRAAIVEQTTGRGSCILLAPDIPGTVVHIQQGVGVTRDGVPAPDGTAPVADRVLKSGDGAVLDWIFDRRPVPGVAGLQAFLHPVADLWRELFLRTLFHQADVAGISLPLLWLYPRNLPALAHLSHDTDQNDPLRAERLLEVVGEAGIHSTWCVILPGYAPELIEKIRAAGHELAMHYDAMSDGSPWSGRLFHEQWQELTRQFQGAQPVTNKNHYLRWEGDMELFEWCVAHGIQLDQSKGASKSGEAGFNFGTCHPYFPVTFSGQTMNVLELPTPTQDLVVFAPPALLDPLLAAVVRSHGILHLLFHPAHIDKDGVAEALRYGIDAARAQGLEWWTAAQINGWERARRQVAWSDYRRAQDGQSVTLRAGSGLEGATVLWLGGEGLQAAVDGTPQESNKVERWGFSFQALTVDVPEKGSVRLELC